MKKEKLYQTLKIDSFDTCISFFSLKTDFVQLLLKKGIPFEEQGEQQILFKSKLFNLDIHFLISVQFNKEKIVAITCSPVDYLDGKLLISRYKEIQKALELIFGKPYNIVAKVLNFIIPENSYFFWRNNEIKIEHYIFERFGIEEIINLKTYDTGYGFS